MLSKQLQQYIAYPKVGKTPKGNFFELALKSISKIKKGRKRSTLSLDIDKILYGKK